MQSVLESLKGLLAPSRSADLLAAYVEEFRDTCRRWKSGEISAAEAHPIFMRLHDAVYRRARMSGDLHSQMAYDFCNLAYDFAAATSFDNKDRAIADLGLDLSRHLGNMCMTHSWKDFVRRRGALEGFSLVRCGPCNRVAPQAVTNRQVGNLFLFCDTCGDLFEYESWDADLARVINAPTGEQRATAERETGVRLSSCPCGGALLPTASQFVPCRYCGSDEVKAVPMSSFEYLQSHTIRPYGSITGKHPASA